MKFWIQQQYGKYSLPRHQLPEKLVGFGHVVGVHAMMVAIHWGAICEKFGLWRCSQSRRYTLRMIKGKNLRLGRAQAPRPAKLATFFWYCMDGCGEQRQ